MQGPYSVVRGMLKLDVLWHVCDSQVICSVFELVISVGTLRDPPHNLPEMTKTTTNKQRNKYIHTAIISEGLKHSA